MYMPRGFMSASCRWGWMSMNWPVAELPTRTDAATVLNSSANAKPRSKAPAYKNDCHEIPFLITTINHRITFLFKTHRMNKAIGKKGKLGTLYYQDRSSILERVVLFTPWGLIQGEGAYCKRWTLTRGAYVCMYIFPLTQYYLQNVNHSKYIYNDLS